MDGQERFPARWLSLSKLDPGIFSKVAKQHPQPGGGFRVAGSGIVRETTWMSKDGYRHVGYCFTTEGPQRIKKWSCSEEPSLDGQGSEESLRSQEPSGVMFLRPKPECSSLVPKQPLHLPRFVT